MSKVFSYSRTMAGAARLARQRGQPVAIADHRIEQPSPVSAPDNVVRLHTVQRVIDLMARMHGCTYAEMKGPSRAYRIVAGRDAAMCAVMVFKPNLSRGQIGMLFNRDPSTVAHAQRKRGLA